MTALSPRLCSLILDSLSCLEAFVYSCTKCLPYASVRGLFAVEEEDRSQIIEAAQKLANNHSDWLQEHGGPALFLAMLTALQIARLDTLLVAKPEFGQPADPRDARKQLVWGLAFIFLPALFFGLILILGRKG